LLFVQVIVQEIVGQRQIASADLQPFSRVNDNVHHLF